jgi:hypothetical protein
VQHALGLDPTGGTDPAAETVQWFNWDESTPSPPQPGRVFNQTSETIDCFNGQLTIFIRQLAPEPPCQGQTFMIDDVEVFDVGPLGPALAVSPSTLVAQTLHGVDAEDQTLTVRNSGTGPLDYTIVDNVDWLSVSPASGTSNGESDTITISFDSSDLSSGSYNAVITVNSDDAVNAPQTVNVTLNIARKPADYDSDGDVDQEDFGWFQTCFTGPGNRMTTSQCAGADFDGDLDVDQDDFGAFQQCMSGAGTPSDPNCAD